MKSKSIIKILLLGLVIGAIFLVGTTKVQAKEYTSEDKNVIISVDDIGISGNDKLTSFGFYNTLYITNANQEQLNIYAQNGKELNCTTKIKISNNAVKAELNGEEIEIENINGNKYAVINETLKYTNTGTEPSKNKDVLSIRFGNVVKYETEYGETYYDYSYENPKLKIYTSETSYEEYYVDNNIIIQSENVPYNYYIRFVNKYGQEYSVLGSGGEDFQDKIYLEYDSSYYHTGTCLIPKSTDLKNVYLELSINVRQGDTIEINDVGTLYYAGIKKKYGETYYIYKNSLDQIKDYNKSNFFTAKTESGYNLTSYMTINYVLSENEHEEEITGEINTSTTNGKMNILFSGNGNAKFESVEISKTDTLYQKVENGLKDINDWNWENDIRIWAYDLYVVEGAYEGPLNITFKVGNEYEGKGYVVGHLKNGLESEYFKGVVKDGKITITVDELSPFVIGVKEDYLLGDVDGNGKVDAQDAVMILKYVAHNIELTDKQLLAANTNKDKTVDAQDAVQILKLVAHNITEF